MSALIDLKATDLLALGIDNGQVDPGIYDFESKQAMKDEFEWTQEDAEIWSYILDIRRGLFIG